MLFYLLLFSTLILFHLSSSSELDYLYKLYMRICNVTVCYVPIQESTWNQTLKYICARVSTLQYIFTLACRFISAFTLNNWEVRSDDLRRFSHTYMLYIIHNKSTDEVKEQEACNVFLQWLYILIYIFLFFKSIPCTWIHSWLWLHEKKELRKRFSCVAETFLIYILKFMENWDIRHE